MKHKRLFAKLSDEPPKLRLISFLFDSNFSQNEYKLCVCFYDEIPKSTNIYI